MTAQWLIVVVMLTLACASVAQEGQPKVVLEVHNETLRLAFDATGATVRLEDVRAGRDVVARCPLAVLGKAGKPVPASSLAATPGQVGPGQTARLELGFGESGVKAVLELAVHPQHVTLEVASVSDPSIDSLTFCDLRTTLKVEELDQFALAGMALNLLTQVPDFPRPIGATRATCYPRFGLAGAKVAVVASSREAMRAVMQQVVSAAPDLPHSAVGGPWAQDAKISRGSYLFNFTDLSEDKVDEWIACARSIGFTQIDFHGGRSFRFGDFLPDPKTYPNGYASLKAVIDRLHAAGIAAGLHTYAFFIDKRTPYVTPVPDPRLAKAAVFTLAAPVDDQADRVVVAESTAKTSAVTGFGVRNSNTIQIDDELITFSGVTKTPPYVFTGCKRGACGTAVKAHAAGARVGHLKECFGLFVPDPETDLLVEIAAKTAEIYNACGFDMIYFDALDGEDVLAGRENGWHYGSKFVFEVAKRLDQPALMEMSTFHHHLWYVRARTGAWDHPNRSHKTFIDLHCASNEHNRRMFMPTNLGWWALKTWGGQSGEPTFADDIEYLCGKAIGYDSSLSMMGINPDNYQKMGAMKELGPILKRYEDLRLSGTVSEPMKARLRVPGDEYTLTRVGEQWRFQPVRYAKHKVVGLDGWSDRWSADNPFAEQPVHLRIQALHGAAAYDDAKSVVFWDPAAADAVNQRNARQGVTLTVESSRDQVKVGAASAKLTGTSTRPARADSWAMVGKVFDPPLDLNATRALGLWVHGDGQGEVLNVQYESPSHLRGVADHYLVIDFTGWRYFELVEPEGERHRDYVWPYGHIYSVYREYPRHNSIERINVWMNNLPPNQPATCYLSPIRALPLTNLKLHHPAVTIGGRTITFPVDLDTGHYLEYRGPDDCKLYDPQGNPLADVTPTGDAPILPAGKSEVQFTCTAPDGRSARANVWVISRGEVLAEG